MADARLALVVDDDPATLELFAIILQQLGFAPTTAAGPVRALRLLLQQPFEALFTDLRMDGPADGLLLAAVAKLIRPSIATYLVTGYLDIADALREIEFAVEAVLLKPISPATLAEVAGQHSAGTETGRHVLPSALARLHLADLVRAEREVLLATWREVRQTDPDLKHVTPEERLDHLGQILDEVVEWLDYPGPPQQKTEAGQLHGKTRRKQSVSARATLTDLTFLRKLVHSLVERHFARLDLVHLTRDLVRVNEALDAEIAASFRGRIEAESSPE